MDFFTVEQQVKVGDMVVARFTNSGRIRQFVGKVEGKTKNYWKVRAWTSPYESEPAGRMFHVSTFEGRQFSVNNRLRPAEPAEYANLEAPANRY